MATPLLIYKYAEASSGTGPSAILDTSSGTALNATITYGASGQWTSIGAGRGLNFGGTATSVTGSLSGTKVQTALGGATAVTVEWCIDSALSSSTYDSYLEIVDGSSTHVVSMTVNHSQGGLIFSAAEGAFPNDCLIKCTIPTSGVLVIHVVVDSTQATAGNRVKVYVNGSLQSITIVDQIGLNAALDAGFNWSTATLTMGAVGAAPQGVTYEGLIYASALNSTEVAAHATSIAANNDADPNSAAAVTIPFRRRPFDVSSWDDPDPSPPRRRVSPRAMPAAAAVLPFRRFNIDWNQFYEPTLYYQGTRSALVQPGPAAPPGFTRPWLAAAASAWEPEAPPFVRARLFPPPSAAPLATSNPFTRPWLLTALDTWTPEYPAPATRLHYPRAVSAGPPTPPVPPTQPTNTGPFDWRADYAAIIGQMFRGGKFPHQI